MLLRSKKLLFSLLVNLSIPTIYMMLASNPLLSSTSIISITGMPALSAMVSSILGGELVYFFLINVIGLVMTLAYLWVVQISILGENWKGK